MILIFYKTITMKITTGTKISLLFALFSFILSFFLLVFINIFSFFSWYNDEKQEVIEKLDQEYLEILSEEVTQSWQKEKIAKEMIEKSGFLWDIPKEYWFVFFDLYKKWRDIFIVIPKNTKFWNLYLPYNVSTHYNNQIDLGFISLFALFVFTILSYFVSKLLFIRFALKDVFFITRKLKNMNLETLEKIDLHLNPKDEIFEITSSINKFLTQIEKNTKNLHEFNSIVSHEFKTPLMIISSQIELAYKTKKYEENLEKIEKQVHLLNELLETFLFISKVQNSFVKIELKSVSISHLLHEIITEIQPIYQEKNISLSLQIKENLTILSDEKLLHLILKNLIDNSFKYTNPKGKIEIILEKNSFCITDNGIWIHKDKLENIFETFYRESDDEKWYGVGLNIVKKSVEILGYTLEVESTKWFWSTFIISFSN